MGRLIDLPGHAVGYAVAMVFWSLASMGHAMANSLSGFVIAACPRVRRSGSFPASIKSVAEWFPKKERALATGNFSTPARTSAQLSPADCSLIVSIWAGAGFPLTGAFGFAWLILWLLLYAHRNSILTAPNRT